MASSSVQWIFSAGSVDLVVHSWKDLPLAEEAGTTVAATLPRADPRDLIIIRKDAEAEMY